MKKRLQFTKLFLTVLVCLSTLPGVQINATNRLFTNGANKEASTTKETETSNLKIHYTFDNVTGKTVTDASGSGYDGTLMNDASILVMGKYKVLKLGNGTGYLNIGKAAGNIVSSMSNYTISAYYRVDKNASLDGSGYFLWAFSSQEANSSSSGPYIAYRLNAQRFAHSTGGYSNEKGIEAGGNATKNTWQHVLYRQNGMKGELYIDGKLAGVNATMPIPNNTFTTAPSYNWIGRAPFTGDSYLKNTLVYDFRFYDQAISNKQISEWALLVKDLNYEYQYGTVGNFTKLKSLLTQYTALLPPENDEKFPQLAIFEFKDAIAVAQDIVEENKASQFVIDESLNTLKSAYEKFRLTEGFETGSSSSQPEFNPEKGFKHPGALHTQEDFDRIKALLLAKDPTIVAAYNRLKANQYSQSGVNTYPVETIVRGGGVGENYMNAARGATMAYQNALRWKISGEKAHAEKAISILNSWASICKAVGGDTNQSLASGIYGYEFANAAELMRDYEGWKEEDFKKFKEWMLYVWYPRCIDFLRRRHGTWEKGTPGHYWSNWGLCNTLAVMSIGILCDDVFIYNQGASFYKNDQVGNFNDNRVPPIDNSGLTEYIGNLVPAVYSDERGPLGYLGQMQESGRDQGHALMALGLAVDICQVGWNQGDDLFALMNNRLAAGIEYVAAYNTGVDNLPWSEYWYHDVRTAYHNSWKQGENNGGGRGAFRPYWDRIIGHYEGIKGIPMPFSEAMKAKDPIDDGCGSYGTTSGGFDHLGVSTLTCSRPAVTSDQAPTLLIPTLVYNGTTYKQSSLGGLKKTFQVSPTTAIPAGSVVKCIPLLPEGTTDTGNWLWDTGSTNKDLEITAHSSALYRVTYTNEKGIQSTQLFSVAVKGDCTPDILTPSITINGTVINDTTLTVIARTPFLLSAYDKMGWGYHRWNNGATTSSIQVENISSDRIYSVTYINQGGKESKLNFHIRVKFIAPFISVDGGTTQEINKIVVKPGQSVELIPIVPSGKENGTWRWEDGTTTQNKWIENVQSSSRHSVSYTYRDETYSLDFEVYVPAANKPFADGDYYIKNLSNGTYLSNDGVTNIPIFREKTEDETDSQIWNITKDGARYKIASTFDQRFLNQYGQFTPGIYLPMLYTYTLYGVEDGNVYAIRNGGSAGTNYWTINGDGSITGKGGTTQIEYAFEIIPAYPSDVTTIPVTENILIYPNPADEYLTILVEENNVSNVTFNLYSSEGACTKTISCKKGENTIQTSDLPSGVYLGILNIDGQEKSIKIIKK